MILLIFLAACLAEVGYAITGDYQSEEHHAQASK